MLTIRPFGNQDTPLLLKLWEITQHRQNNSHSGLPLTHNWLHSQVLGLPMFDIQSIMLAFDGKTPIGYVHTTSAPSENGESLDPSKGQICFMCVVPDYHDISGAASALLRAGEEYLLVRGAKKIFGGSPSPSAPFYTGLYGGGEAVGILQSDKHVVEAFQQANYQIHQKTCWFSLEIHGYTSPPLTADTIDYYGDYRIEISEIENVKSWWEGCTLTNGFWFDAIAFLVRTNKPVALIRMRITYPDTGYVTMYSDTWLASLIELRVHPEYIKEPELSKFLLSELIKYLAQQKHIAAVASHVAEDTPLFTLLRRLSWNVQDNGYVFVKTF